MDVRAESNCVCAATFHSDFSFINLFYWFDTSILNLCMRQKRKGNRLNWYLQVWNKHEVQGLSRNYDLVEQTENEIVIRINCLISFSKDFELLKLIPCFMNVRNL